jgi:amino acid permease
MIEILFLIIFLNILIIILKNIKVLNEDLYELLFIINLSAIIIFLIIFIIWTSYYKKNKIFKNLRVDVNNIEYKKLYTIEYKDDKSKPEIKCACDIGDTTSTFNNIKYYDMSTKKTNKSEDLKCQCSSELNDNHIFYVGNKKIIQKLKNK